MLFPKGPRFIPEKTSDVPGPNTYNVTTEPTELYKRGAFLEKTDRFSKEKNSEVPGPGTYNAESKCPTKPSHPDRYVILLRRLEDLEKVHADDKKSHNLELERCKLELARSQKTNTDQSERLDKIKKQNDAYETRLQDYKKSSASDQTELKELRAKVRRLEHENGQISGKQTEASDIKKALHSLEAKRKDDIRDRDRKIMELEKGIAAERKKREVAEGCLQEAKGKADRETQQAHDNTKNLQYQLDSTKREIDEARQTFNSWKTEAESREEELVQQLEQCKRNMVRVAESYGRLATSTVTASQHALLKSEHVALRMRAMRLERKLANSEAQVTELANLVRYTKEDNIFLRQRNQDAENEAGFYRDALLGQTCWSMADFHPSTVLTAIKDEARLIEADIADGQKEVYEAFRGHLEGFCNLYRLHIDDLLTKYSINDHLLRLESDIGKIQEEDLSRARLDYGVISSQLQNVRTELSSLQESLVDTQTALQKSIQAQGVFQRRSTELENQMRDETSKHKEALQKERDIVQKLTATARMSKTSEETLQATIEQLNIELIEATRFQEAYYGLVDETEALVARNNLAEEEASRLSHFNAQILGHNNPAQRILYVDRIRRELADVKQKLLTCTLERDTVAATNEDLRHELGMYASAIVPIDDKPRTAMTRVARPPLISQSLNVPSHIPSDSLVQKNDSKTVSVSNPVPSLESIAGDMTLDEIM
ncbi:hypothetical protein BJ138DRAFT_1180154 [Hygrophoropsis aurantiaca]|uniref:Uncharacterized protein n=1 Tax=Hygrophoropsis aurantiaca TaxID=72124 RepID=A0ACB8AAS6_9AGAM|nr:hypothetical protein BJ138DRAFT_1180154 [Hygrophoropsis aurantiaca]